MTMVRLVDIAREANITVPVVSAVLNEKRGKKGTIRVSDSMRETILEIADRLGYTPNIMARVLKGKASGLIGVMLDSGDVAVRFRQLDAFEKYCAKSGYHLLITEASREQGWNLSNYRLLLQHGVDGILCHRNVFHDELRKNPKVVIFGAEPLEGITSLYYNIGTAYREAARIFAEEKRRRPALIVSAGDVHDSVPARINAFRAHFGGTAPIFTIEKSMTNSCSLSAQMHKMLKNKLLPQKIDSVLLQNDLWALSFCEQARLQGVEIPWQISVIGQDNSAFTECCEPNITTIDPNLMEFGKVAFDLLVERITGPDAPPKTVKVDTRLIERGTTLSTAGRKLNSQNNVANQLQVVT